MQKFIGEHWWKLLLVPIIGWASYVTLLAINADNRAVSNREEVEQLRNEKVAELKDYVDMQVGVLHNRISKVHDENEADIKAITWRFFEQQIADCTEECKE